MKKQYGARVKSYEIKYIIFIVVRIGDTKLPIAYEAYDCVVLHFTDSAHDKYSQLVEERTVAENEVQFLNSVIVDMQRKNETLLERVQYLENIIPPDLLYVFCACANLVVSIRVN
jgi:hypothetical protein